MGRQNSTLGTADVIGGIKMPTDKKNYMRYIKPRLIDENVQGRQKRGEQKMSPRKMGVYKSLGGGAKWTRGGA